MEKYQADELALQLVNSILKTEPSALASGSAAVDARHIADFVKTLSDRFQQDLDDFNVTPTLD
ncbi:hypothetical protein [Histophilus somni]|uniref:Uncharacterized protein n=1 Tax=Histophilus somni TaxID=731 RepID=A0A9Q6Z190_HISSO|nr:hypothetical protein [Histophilus somni]ARU66146.1 hypothetical protein BTV19_01975 [Histophilus somni]ARU68020.1 hypothetical protein BTV16_01980 [Histophilus somni]ARU69900.1 hypothetical protein BTV20_01980 [Histophilus somni]ARU71775.1 hypothetical protein BTV17_01975 [Histophilus somni]ARU76539.1 hypothetical protein BTV21_08070 [Histophilus somni]